MDRGGSPVGEQPLSIGQLARLSGLTPKALRHYDRVGLLMPARVDSTGARFYGRDQLTTARRIARLRAVDLPLDDVRAYLAAAGSTAGADAAAAVLTRHRTRLESRLTRLGGALHELQHLLTDGVDHSMTTPTPDNAESDRRLGIDLFNATWTLMELENRSVADDDLMVHTAHASAYHWRQVGTAANFARSEWQCSRVYALLRRSEPCLHHAQRVLDICTENGIGDWDLAFSYEALARGHAIAGNSEAARMWTERALAALDDVADEQDRALVVSDLETIPGQPRFW